MNIFGRRKHSTHRDQDSNKDRQLRELKAVFPSIRRPNNDDSLFSFQFCVDNKYSSLRIFIPSDFPNVRPVLQVDGPVQHPWLDPFKQVNGCEKLLSWTKNSSLVEIVEECIAALSAGANTIPGAARAAPIPADSNYSSYPAVALNYPNTPMQQPTAQFPATSYPTDNLTALNATGYPPHASSNTQTALATGASFHIPSETQQQQQQQRTSPLGMSRPMSLTREVSEDASSTNIHLPALPDSFPELEDMTIEQLERLMSDSVALQAHVEKQEGVKSMEALLEQLKLSNYEITVRNLKLGEELDRLHINATEKQQELAKAKEEFEAAVAAARSKYQVPKEQIMQELKKKSAAADAATDQIGLDFAEGKKSLPEFINEFMESRKKYHSLCAKISTLDRISC